MKNQIIFNLPVKDLEKSKAFFAKLGFGFNPHMSNDKAAAMVIAKDSIQVMLMTEDFFTSLTGKPVAQAKDGNEVIICMMCDSGKEVADIVAKAVENGARTPHPLEDEGFMVTQGFEDLDGHLWNFVWMAPQAANGEAA